MDIELEQKCIKIEFLENIIGFPDCKVIEEVNERGLKKLSTKRKGDKIMDRLNISLNNHKYIKKSSISKTFKRKFCFDKDLFIETLQNKYLFVFFCLQSHLSLLSNGIYKL